MNLISKLVCFSTYDKLVSKSQSWCTDHTVRVPEHRASGNCPGLAWLHSLCISLSVSLVQCIV